MLVNCGVEYIGFPLRLTVNKEDVTEEEAKEIINKIKGKSKPVLITYLSHHNEIADFCDFLNVNIVQLHGEIETTELEKLISQLPELIVIKSLIVKQNNLDELLRKSTEFSPFVDAFIIDTFDPKTGAEGATGKTHDWKISAELVKKLNKPVILAGGLTPQNVADAIKIVRPAGVDSHTGVEDANGNKDEVKVREFISNAKRAYIE